MVTLTNRFQKQRNNEVCSYICVFIYGWIGTGFSTNTRSSTIFMAQIYRPYFLYWAHGEKRLQSFLRSLINSTQIIKFTHELSRGNISFLHVNVKLSEGKFEPNLDVKPTDRHQYLHYSSSHAEFTKRSIVFSQDIRVSRTCPYEKNFRKNTMEMKSWFLERGYRKGLVGKELGKIKFFNKVSNKQKRYPLCHYVLSDFEE